MSDEWDITDEEMDAWAEEWAVMDRAAAEYLQARIPGVGDPLTEEEARVVGALAETISPSEAPSHDDIEAVSAVMALQHADWLGLALGVVKRGAGSALDGEVVQADIDGLDEVDGEIEDPQGHLGVLELALLHLTPLWQDLGVLDEDGLLTERGVWALPRVLNVIWGDKS